MLKRNALLVSLLACAVPAASARQQPPEPLTFQTDLLPQATIASGSVTLKDIRTRGLAVFATPFTEDIGYGDGPINTADKTSPGGRPTR